MIADAVSQLVTFSAGNKVASQGRVTYKMTAPANKGCQETTTANGIYAISGSGDSQNIVFTYATGTIAREGCAAPTDDLASRAMTDPEMQAVNNSGGKFVLSGNTFKLTDTINGMAATYTFTKQ